MEYKELESGIAVPYYIQSAKKKKPTAFSFFSGCGGMDLGFIQAGFEVVGANEFDPSATLTYLTNLASYPVQIHYIEGMKDKDRLNDACEKYIFGIKNQKQRDEFERTGRYPRAVEDAKMGSYEKFDTKHGLYNKAIGSGFAGSGWIRHNPEASPVRNFWFGDVRKLKGQDILDALDIQQGDLDCVCGGPPCQGFSQAGKQNIADPRNNLVYEYARLIVELQPKTFIMEEVPAIINFFDLDGVPVLDKFCLLLQEGGFGKYELLKKSMVMQAGNALGLKGERGNKSIKKTKHHIAKPSLDTEQLNLFD